MKKRFLWAVESPSGTLGFQPNKQEADLVAKTFGGVVKRVKVLS